MDSLEQVIKSNFYRNEEDATIYYDEHVKRKKKFGGVYNEKFLEQIGLREKSIGFANVSQEDEIDIAIDEEEDNDDN